MIRPNEKQSLSIVWQPENYPNYPSLTHINELELGPALTYFYKHAQNRSIQVERFRPMTNVMVQNISPYDITISHQNPLGRITRGTFGPYPCAVLTLGMSIWFYFSKILDQ